jgi:8-oxo-dGTP diphosphatase
MSAAPAHDCVGALPVREGRVLLGRRADDRDWLPGAWDLFGGHVEPGESHEAALRRELLEELGIVPLQLRELGVLEAADRGWRLRVYALDDWEGDARNRQPREHVELRWMEAHEAAGLLAAAHPDFPSLIAAAV